MTTQQENKLSMYLAVKAVCARHQTVWQSLPAFADAVTRFESHLDAIKTLTPSQGRRKTGLADDKKRLRLEMTQTAHPIAAATLAYANTAQLGELARRVDYPLTGLQSGRDTTSATRCEEIHAAASSVLSQLAAYGVTSADLVRLKTLIDAYREILPKPREAQARGKTATHQIAVQFKAADAVLNDQLDLLLVQFTAKAPVFVADFQNARLIVKSAATRPGDAPVPPTPAPGS